MYVRPFNADDAPVFFRWYHDPRLSHFFRGFITGVSIDQCRAAPQFMKAHILVGCQEELLGAVTLADQNHILRIYKLGLLTDPYHQHKGVGRDIMAAGLDFAFNTMNAHKVILEVLEEDTRVLHGARAIGFIQEGVSRDSIFFEGKFHNEVVFSMLGTEYAIRSKL